MRVSTDHTRKAEPEPQPEGSEIAIPRTSRVVRASALTQHGTQPVEQCRNSVQGREAVIL